MRSSLLEEALEDSAQANSEVRCVPCPRCPTKPRSRRPARCANATIGSIVCWPAAQLRLLEGFLDLGIPELLGRAGALTAQEIYARLGLQPHRGWKFLHLLALCGLLVEEGGASGADDARYRLSDEAKAYFGAAGTEGYFLRDLVQYWRNVAVLPFTDVLRGMPLPLAVRWPPPGPAESEHLETWMRLTAEGSIKTICASGALHDVQRLLDVGGGDGTIGCASVNAYPGSRRHGFQFAGLRFHGAR